MILLPYRSVLLETSLFRDNGLPEIYIIIYYIFDLIVIIIKEVYHMLNVK